VAGDREERNRVLGVSMGEHRQLRPNEEQQRVLGFPVDSFGSVDREWFGSMAHPVRTYKQWARRRRLGPYVTDEDET
jgi:hypothetical protein